MQVKTILNRCHRFKCFVYGTTYFGDDGATIHVAVTARKGSRGVCSGCEELGPTYDTARTPRGFAFVPLWGFAVWLWYAMRRIDCPDCGVTVEKVPWAAGKNSTCNAYRLFLARWARRLSWSEVGRIFQTNWGVVYRAIRWVVDYGLAHRDLDGVQAIGVDEIAVWKGHKYLTVVYQIDQGVRRLLWVGKERTVESFRGFFTMFGAARAQALRFIASDMWKPYLDVAAELASQAVHVLDRFHIVATVNKAVDEVRAGEARELARQGYQPVLKHTRWCFLKRPENLTDNQRTKLADVSDTTCVPSGRTCSGRASKRSGTTPTPSRLGGSSTGGVLARCAPGSSPSRKWPAPFAAIASSSSTGSAPRRRSLPLPSRA